MTTRLFHAAWCVCVCVFVGVGVIEAVPDIEESKTKREKDGTSYRSMQLASSSYIYDTILHVHKMHVCSVCVYA